MLAPTTPTVLTPEVVCVQPFCGRHTRDFYRVDQRVARELDGVEQGHTCVPCWEDIVRRATREHVYPVC